jgi:hypothetical protein
MHRSLETRINLLADLYNISIAKIDLFKTANSFLFITKQCFLSGEIMYKGLSESPVIFGLWIETHFWVFNNCVSKGFLILLGLPNCVLFLQVLLSAIKHLETMLVSRLLISERKFIIDLLTLENLGIVKRLKSQTPTEL